MHSSDATLLALIHGELDDLQAGSVKMHLADCAACRAHEAALRAGDAEIGRLLAVLDHPAPRLSAPTARGRPRLRHTALAASLALLLAGGAAAAVPGTALNRWIRSRLESAPPTAPRFAPQAPAAVPTAPAQAAGGVELPARGALVVAFAAPESQGALTISVADRADATLRAYGGDVAYQVGNGRIEVDNRHPAQRYTLEVPAVLDRLTVLVAGRPVFDSAEHPLGRAPATVSLSPESPR